MKFSSYFILFFALFALTTTSCGKGEPCDEVTCPTGFICQDGTCVDDPNFDPCAGVTCGANQTCVDGTCVDNFDVQVVSGAISSNTTWEEGTVYELASKVIVNNGVTLTIQPGVIVKGRPGTGSLASALVVARGGKIIADGTAAKPIIFTSTTDNIVPGQLAGTNLDKFDNETWGGLILLGNAPISAEFGDTETQIEGIPADEEYGRYGGNNPADNSGVLRYISVRHGGALIGDGNEINGITLGGVGNGTTIEFVEVAANLDDGIEFFGGTVNVKNAIVCYQGDDAIDIDMNYSGTVDNFLVVHGGDDTDEGLEIDGPENVTHTGGLFTLKNGTLIAADQVVTSGADLKSKAQGTIENCVWKGYAKHIKVRSSFDPTGCAPKDDAYTNMVELSKLFITNCEVEGSISATDVARVYSDDDPGEEDCFNLVATSYESEVDAKIVAGNNAVVSSATKGANTSVFDNWTLASQKNWY